MLHLRVIFFFPIRLSAGLWSLDILVTANVHFGVNSIKGTAFCKIVREYDFSGPDLIDWQIYLSVLIKIY